MKSIIESSSELLAVKRNSKAIILSTVMAISGVALIIISNSMDVDKSSTAYITLATLGVVAILCSFLPLRNAKKMVYAQTGSSLNEASIYFRPEDLSEVSNAIRNLDVPALTRLHHGETAGLRLDVVYSQDGNFAAYQLCKYVPHNYEPATEVKWSQDDKTNSFCEFIKGAE